MNSADVAARRTWLRSLAQLYVMSDDPALSLQAVRWLALLDLLEGRA